MYYYIVTEPLYICIIGRVPEVQMCLDSLPQDIITLLHICFYVHKYYISCVITLFIFHYSTIDIPMQPHIIS